MFKKSLAVLVAAFSLTACAANQPRVIQASVGNPEILIMIGMATQVELPEQERVASAVVGNKDLVSLEQQSEVITLSAKGGAGETNLIVRARDDSGKTKVYQYRVIVQAP